MRTDHLTTEVSPGHMIYCSDSEFEEYKKIRQAVTIQ